MELGRSDVSPTRWQGSIGWLEVFDFRPRVTGFDP